MYNYKATKKYKTIKIKRYVVEINRETETQVLEKIASVTNKSGYLKELIAKDKKVFKKYIKK